MTTAKATKMSADQVIQKYQEAWNHRDAAALSALYATDAVAYDPFHPQPLRGREAIRKDWQDWFRAFPDVQAKFNNNLGKGEVIGFAAVITGTHKAPMAGPKGTIAASNRRVEMQGATFCRLNPQGQIVEQRCYYDTGSLMQQLGVTTTA